MRVLVVDDDPLIRKLLTRLMTTMEVQCTEASNHSEAMEHIGLAEFDSALVDVNLGSDDGLDLAVLMKDMKRNLRIVVMSADPANEFRVVEMGFGQMLHKPFTLEDLKKSLTRG